MPKTLTGLRVKGRVLRTGVAVPPPSGPVRDEILRTEGGKSLRACSRRYGSVLLAIMPLLPLELQDLPGSGGMLRAITPSNKERWNETRAVLRTSGRRVGATSPPGEADARAALMHAVDAYNYLEDTELATKAHAWIHKAGALVGGLYGCRLPLDEDGVWWDTCPVSLAHKRIGWSPGFTARRMCAICRQDFSECRHLPGEFYAVVARRQEGGECSICFDRDCEEHEIGATHMVRPSAIIIDADLREISMVPRPRDPLARLTDVEIEKWIIRSVLGPIPRGATSITCMRCVDPCGGFSTPTNLDPRPAS